MASNAINLATLVLLLLPMSLLLMPSHSLVDESNTHCHRLEDTDCKSKMNYFSLSEKKTIYLGLMLSFPDRNARPSLTSDFDDGHDIAPSVYLAARQVNDRSDLLKDYEIDILRFDGGCDVFTRTAVGLNELFCSCKRPIIGLIGPSCEKSSQHVSQLTNRKDHFSMVSINYGSENNTVSEYNYSFGILGPNSIYSMAIVDLIKLNNWMRPALIYSGKYSKHVEILLQLANATGVKFELSSPIYETFIPIKELKTSFSRVIVILASPATIFRVLCVAYHEGVTFPSYQWIFPEALDATFLNWTSFTYDEQDYHCSDDEISMSLNGSINLFLNALSEDQDVHREIDSGHSIEEYRSNYKLQAIRYAEEFGVNSQPVPWANGMYDAVWLLAIALNNSLPDFNHSLTDFRPGSMVLAERIRKRLLDINFHGISGHISFDRETGFSKEGSLILYQYGGNRTSLKVALYEGNFTFISNHNASFINDSFNTHYAKMEIGVTIVLACSTTISLVLAVLGHAMNTCFREHKAIKASSPVLNHLIFLGCYAVIFALILNILETYRVLGDTIRFLFCNASLWFINIGHTLILGTVCMKTWRLKRIYAVSKKLSKEDIKYISNPFLFGCILVFVALEACICMTMNIIDLKKFQVTKHLDTSMSEPVLIVKEMCSSRYSLYWFLAFSTPKAILTLASFLMAYSTKFNIKELSTSNIIILAYLLAILLGMSSPLFVIFHIVGIDITVEVGLMNMFSNILLHICIIVSFYIPLIHSIIAKKCHCKAHRVL